jgi:hypothetical protein
MEIREHITYSIEATGPELSALADATHYQIHDSIDCPRCVRGESVYRNAFQDFNLVISDLIARTGGIGG